MDIRSAVLKTINAVPGKWAVAAAHLGMTENALRNRAYETKGQSLDTDHKLALQQLSGATYFAEAVAAASGGTFVRLPAIDGLEYDSIQQQFNQNYAELGALFALFTEAVKDGRIDQIEKAKLEGQVQQVHRKVETLRALIFSIYSPRANAMASDMEVRHG